MPFYSGVLTIAMLVKFRLRRLKQLRTAKAEEEAEDVHDTVFGAMDGMICTMAVISGVAGATSDNTIILIAGIAALLAEAVSMGFSGYMSDKLREGILAAKRIKDYEKPERESIMLLLTTLGGGILILIPFAIFIPEPLTWSILLAGFLLFGLGARFAKLAKRNALIGGIETMTFGMFAAAVTYFVGYVFALVA